MSDASEWRAYAESAFEHSRILGIAQPPTSKAAIHKAYRAAAKLWHPDRFEGNLKKRLEAEERFKRIHAAYQALCEHFENPARRAVRGGFCYSDPQQSHA